MVVLRIYKEFMNPSLLDKFMKWGRAEFRCVRASDRVNDSGFKTTRETKGGIVVSVAPTQRIKSVMADPDVCIGCRTCMAACLSKHDVLDDIAVARLNLVSTMKISAPIVCQHCADAPCAQVCPTHVLYRDGGRVAVNEAACIGCRGCVAACPYGAVNVVTRTVTTRLGDLVLEQHEKPTVIKCDLCADRLSGPACIEACPTKGLVLVDKVELARRQIKAENRAS